jgi:glycosyltransferase involved in cell wall biosynthesis
VRRSGGLPDGRSTSSDKIPIEDNRLKAMRILIVHNAYQQRGGEDAVVESETQLLRSRGHDVRTFVRHNNEIEGMGKGALAQQTWWSRESVERIDQSMSAWHPDIVHVHNTFPLISPSVYWAVARKGIPVVQTLHNFRLICPQAMFLLEGRICEDCVGHSTWRSVTRGCYRKSKLQSAVLTGMLSLHRSIGTYKNKVTRYIALNDFCRRKFIEGGLPADKIVIKPNFVDYPAPQGAERDGFLFVGRLSAEKGTGVLAEAARQAPEVCVRIAGTGPEAHQLQDVPNAKMLGALGGDDVRRQMETATALVLPSIWYENFPRTLVEAYAAGLPVIGSRLGALEELIEDGVTGLLFEPGNADDLASKIRWAQSNAAAMAEMGRRARAHYDNNFTATKNYDQLISIYEEAMSAARSE